MSEAVAQAPAESRASGFLFRFGIPLALALVVHAIAILALVEGWSVADDSRYVRPVQTIDARLIQLEAQAAPAPAQVVERPAPRAAPETRPEPARNAPRTAAPEPRAEAEQAAAEPSPEPDPAPTSEAPQSTRQADFEDDALRELLDRGLEDAIASEAARLGSERAEAAVASYVGAIVRRIEQNWSRPPSARNGMRAELLIGLVPTGELVTVEIVASSGSAAFDRSAQLAVRDAAPFDVPEDPVLFEREFRNLRILFRPEDLRN